MKKVIGMLTIINKPFQKHLFIIIPTLTLLLNCYEAFIEYNSGKQPEIPITFISIIVTGYLVFLYLISGKKELSYVAGIITFFYMSMMGVLFKLIEVTAIIAVPLLIGFIVMFIITMLVMISSIRKNFQKRFSKRRRK